MELLWPMYGPLDLNIQLRKVFRLFVFLARAPELVWAPIFSRFREKCEGF